MRKGAPLRTHKAIRMMCRTKSSSATFTTTKRTVRAKGSISVMRLKLLLGLENQSCALILYSVFSESALHSLLLTKVKTAYWCNEMFYMTGLLYIYILYVSIHDRLAMVLRKISRRPKPGRRKIRYGWYKKHARTALVPSKTIVGEERQAIAVENNQWVNGSLISTFHWFAI